MLLKTDSSQKLQCDSLADLERVAKAIIQAGKEHSVWLFYGEMGAGKTTLIREICKQLQVVDSVSSPTYSIINEYLTINQNTIYHFDFYRLKSEAEAMDIGVEEYFYSGKLCLLEWPSVIPSLLPDHYLSITISATGVDQKRIIELNRYEG